jgi:hypothetical protein
VVGVLAAACLGAIGCGAAIDESEGLSEDVGEARQSLISPNTWSGWGQNGIPNPPSGITLSKPSTSGWTVGSNEVLWVTAQGSDNKFYRTKYTNSASWSSSWEAMGTNTFKSGSGPAQASWNYVVSGIDYEFTFNVGLTSSNSVMMRRFRSPGPMSGGGDTGWNTLSQLSGCTGRPTIAGAGNFIFVFCPTAANTVIGVVKTKVSALDTTTYHTNWTPVGATGTCINSSLGISVGQIWPDTLSVFAMDCNGGPADRYYWVNHLTYTANIQENFWSGWQQMPGEVPNVTLAAGVGAPAMVARGSGGRVDVLASMNPGVAGSGSSDPLRWNRYSDATGWTPTSTIGPIIQLVNPSLPQKVKSGQVGATFFRHNGVDYIEVFGEATVSGSGSGTGKIVENVYRY